MNIKYIINVFQVNRIYHSPPDLPTSTTFIIKRVDWFKITSYIHNGVKSNLVYWKSITMPENGRYKNGKENLLAHTKFREREREKIHKCIEGKM